MQTIFCNFSFQSTLNTVYWVSDTRVLTRITRKFVISWHMDDPFDITTLNSYVRYTYVWRNVAYEIQLVISDTLMQVRTDGVYTQEHTWIQTDLGYFKFKVKACSDAHVALGYHPFNASSVHHEVILGMLRTSHIFNMQLKFTKQFLFKPK